MHYRGLRGCRVSFLIAPKGDDSKGRDRDDLIQTALLQGEVVSDFWEGTRFKFALLATGMDDKRFNSISSYLRLKGERNLPATKEEQYVMQQVYEASKACA